MSCIANLILDWKALNNMKITRNKNIQSCDTLDKKEILETEEVCDDQELCDELGVVSDTHAKAKELIQQTIDILSTTAIQGNTVSRDAIADLSVVLFEL